MYRVTIESDDSKVYMELGPSAQVFFSPTPPWCFLCGDPLVNGDPMVFHSEGIPGEPHPSGFYDLLHLSCAVEIDLWR